MTEFSKLVKKVHVKVIFADGSDMTFGIDGDKFFSAFGDIRPDKPGVYMEYSTPMDDKDDKR